MRWYTAIGMKKDDAHVCFVSGRSLAGAERRHGSGADGDVPGADRRLANFSSLIRLMD